MKRISGGFLIVIEGIDGSGKSTVARSVAQYLQEQGYLVVATREPGGTELGKDIRQLLQHSHVRPLPEAEFLLFAADRAHHVATVVRPALAAGSIVISDRMGDSSMAYQGYGRGIDRQMIASVNQWVMRGITPDLLLYIDLDWETALQRIQQSRAQLTAFEQEECAFFQRVAQGFEEIFKGREQVVHIDGTCSAEVVKHEALAAVVAALEKRR